MRLNRGEQFIDNWEKSGLGMETMRYTSSDMKKAISRATKSIMNAQVAFLKALLNQPKAVRDTWIKDRIIQLQEKKK